MRLLNVWFSNHRVRKSVLFESYMRLWSGINGLFFEQTIFFFMDNISLFLLIKIFFFPLDLIFPMTKIWGTDQLYNSKQMTKIGGPQTHTQV